MAMATSGEVLGFEKQPACGVDGALYIANLMAVQNRELPRHDGLKIVKECNVSLLESHDCLHCGERRGCEFGGVSKEVSRQTIFMVAGLVDYRLARESVSEHIHEINEYF